MASLFELQNPNFGQLTKTKVIKTENGAHTLTTAELIEGIVDGTPTGNRAVTTPTAAEILTALGAQNKIGQTFELTIVNKATSTHKFTLTAGSNVTIVGDADVAAASSGTFVFRVTSTTAVSAFRK
tara:strand:+ start:14725 stop:15102 length:378 start_codon:yes stop_codon:yes gene_type:complete